uniref:Rapsyn myristoylation/linker region N-terminal domain-containing protein n=1 Tax=Ditylenchus dipsaci TaxID=166011 RepID=A0A915EAC4_9BILA
MFAGWLLLLARFLPVFCINGLNQLLPLASASIFPLFKGKSPLVFPPTLLVFHYQSAQLFHYSSGGVHWHALRRTSGPMGIRFELEEPSMGQRYAKHQMQSGVRLYHQRHYQQAIGRWRSAMLRLRSAEDRFITLGYMAQAFCDAGDYESMLHYALSQMELANSRQDDFMKSEAFLNLSKAYERLADYSKAISYGRASLQHPNIDSRTPGYAHLSIALAQLGFSQFQSSLEEFEHAMNTANGTGDKLLELQVCVGLGSLFTLLKDLNKALIFLRNALSILHVAPQSSLVDAKEACEEALRLSQQTGNRSIYARCLCSMADINRELGESEAKETITKSWARYEQSFRLMRQINDRMGEVIVLGSMSKSASESRSHYTGQCECQAIQLNKKCLELAKIIGCKHAMMKCHFRLQELFGQLADEDSEEEAGKACISLIQEMELFCNFCGQRYGAKSDSLQALRCLHQYLAEGKNKTCPKCQCKAVVMDNLSSSTKTDSSVSSTVEPTTIVEQRPIFLDTSTSHSQSAETITIESPPNLLSTSTSLPCSPFLKPAHYSSSVDQLHFVQPVQITAESPTQQLTLSASTSSIMFASNLSYDELHKKSAKKSILYGKSPPAKCTNSSAIVKTNRAFASKHIKLSEESPTCSSASKLNDFGVVRAGSAGKKKKVPPPVPARKPCCRTDAFPSLPEELFSIRSERLATMPKQISPVLEETTPVSEATEVVSNTQFVVYRGPE